MIEIPESKTVARQVRETLTGRTITDVFNATHPHKFTWYAGDPLDYPKLLTGRKIVGAEGFGAYIEILLDDDVRLAVSDGTIMRLMRLKPKFRPNISCLSHSTTDAFWYSPSRCMAAFSLSGGRLKIPITWARGRNFRR